MMVNDRKPDWLRVTLASNGRYAGLKKGLRELGLKTICEEARCPNIFECWTGGTATILLMGDMCTRGCRFCAVSTGNPHGALDAGEPERVAAQVAGSGLTYVVLTSVDRDDLSDGGAHHIAETVRSIKRLNSGILVEVLMPDFGGDRDALDKIIASGADVLAHNVETVRRLTPSVRDRRATYDQSLDVLEYLKKASGGVTKTSLMVGLGETFDEIIDALHDVRERGVDAVTLGQYLRPSDWHLPVSEYIPPEVFDRYAEAARGMGFIMVASGPLVRSSYRAGELFFEGVLRASPAVGAGSSNTFHEYIAANMKR
ncbi:MAG: lipoyl synthase [Thermoplasmata archaeon]|nr:lipoyl synthase [Candidatus Sysuiplasma acidicola]